MPTERDVALSALLNFNGTRNDLPAAVVMDDHIHVVAWPRPPYDIDAVVTSWRSFIANTVMRQGTRRAPVWQRGGYDRVVWEGGELAEKVQCALDNPRRRWPDAVADTWVWPPGEAQ